MKRSATDTRFPPRQQYIAGLTDCALGGTLIYSLAAYAFGIPRGVAFVIVLLSVVAAGAIVISRIRHSMFRPASGCSLLYAPVVLPLAIAFVASAFTYLSLTNQDLYGAILGFSVTLGGALLGKAIASNSAVE